MKYRIRKNTRAEDAYVRDLERCGPLERVERGEAKILSPSEYPEPLMRFLERDRMTIRIPLTPSAKKRLEQLSRATGKSVHELASRWFKQGLAREAG